MWQWTAGSIVVFFILCVSLSLAHNDRAKIIRLHESTYTQLLEEAAMRSITASKTVNPAMALIEVTRALQLIEVVHSMQGQQHLSYITGVDTAKMRNTIRTQRAKITRDLLETFPDWSPSHPMQDAGGMPRATPSLITPSDTTPAVGNGPSS
jgi:hypothetical protein